MAASLALAGCHPAPRATLTGSEGGLLPGMEPPGPELTSAQAAKLNSPPSITQTTQVQLPDGGVRIDRTIGGVLYSQAWYNSAGVPQRSVIYADGHVPMRYFEYGDNGQIRRATTWYPGTTQAQRVEDYNEDGIFTTLTEYWPNGRKRILSERNVETPTGTVWRVQEWYENGLRKSVSQRDDDGLPEGRQTTWNADGTVVSDGDYYHGVLQTDYLGK
ncbi:MAG: hypothetical protein ABSH19_09215 [Opitutales bacterium]